MTNSLSKIMKISTFFMIFLIGFSYSMDAQNRTNRNKTDDYFDEGGFGPHRFWFGGGIGLGFNGGGNSSQFQFALSPMVGYKLTPNFSVGPRVELEYSHVRFATGPSTSDKFNLFNYGVGAFARYKIFNPFFIHAEYQLESRSNPVGGGETIRRSRDNFFVGAGYSSGGGLIGYEISILWNLLEDGSVDLPLDYRIAFTYNF